jgi:hypothetical protein
MEQARAAAHIKTVIFFMNENSFLWL